MVIGDWLLVIGYWLLVNGYWLLAIAYWLLVIGYWSLVIGYWLLAIGYWLLVIGYWLLANSVFQSDHLQRKTWKVRWLWTFASTSELECIMLRCTDYNYSDLIMLAMSQS